MMTLSAAARRLSWCLALAPVLAWPADRPARPNLVVVISIDQCRADYLERFRPYFVAGGFNRLLNGGAGFTDCHYAHATTKTGPGHAVMLTGVHPQDHGIVANEWLLPAWPSLESVNCVEDRDAPLVGLAPRRTRSPGGVLEAKAGRSPRHLLAPTLGDQLKETYGARAKVFGVGDKDRAAILMSGRGADGAYWTEEGRVVTSTYYRPALPNYFAEFNAEQRVEKIFGREWARLLPPMIYEKVQGPDDAAGEYVGVGLTRTFPKRIDGGQAVVGKDFYTAYDNSPWDNDLVADMARAVVINEHLGEADGAPDLLAIGFSQPDNVGHNYGPASHEVMDTFLRLDRTLAEFFRFLDESVGLEHCTLVLTSDHGVAPVPDRTPDRGGRVRVLDLDAQIAAALNAEFGPLADGERWAARDGLGYHLNQVALDQKKLPAAPVEGAIERSLLTVPSVAAVFTSSQLTGAAALDPIGESLRLGYFPTRSPEVLFVLKPYFIDRVTPGTTHGSPYEYDTHVPLLFYGVGVKPGTYPERVGVHDLAPTLDHLLGLPPLPQSHGRILF